MTRSFVIPTRRRRWLPGALFAATTVVALMAAWHLMQLATWWTATVGGAAQFEAGYQAGVESFSDVVGGAYATGYRTGQQAACTREAPL
jgi:hypothetical protein